MKKAQQSDWEQEFDKMWADLTKPENLVLYNKPNSIKSFISAQIKKTRAETLKEVLPKDNLVDGKNARTEYGEGYSNGFKSCYQQIINKALKIWGIKL